MTIAKPSEKFSVNIYLLKKLLGRISPTPSKGGRRVASAKKLTRRCQNRKSLHFSLLFKTYDGSSMSCLEVGPVLTTMRSKRVSWPWRPIKGVWNQCLFDTGESSSEALEKVNNLKTGTLRHFWDIWILNRLFFEERLIRVALFVLVWCGFWAGSKQRFYRRRLLVVCSFEKPTSWIWRLFYYDTRYAWFADGLLLLGDRESYIVFLHLILPAVKSFFVLSFLFAL